MNPVEPTTPLAATMQAQEWNQILSLLGETGPWRIVNPLINKLGEQVQTAAGQVPAQPLANGRDTAHVPD